MTRSQLIVSNIQVTIKAHGPLVCLLFCYVNFVMSNKYNTISVFSVSSEGQPVWSPFVKNTEDIL